MSPAILAVLLAGALPMPGAATPGTPTLAAARGRERLLILFAPAAADPLLAAQERLFAADPAALRERDLRIVRVAGAAVGGLDARAAALRARFGVDRRAFALRLIGKDGHVAIARATPIAAAALFGAIDAMPMRQDELRRRRR